ncbi:MAG TPA: c-type cytochrome [Candidatus Acidoferrales bacterium]|nr:c-type cytochrome [Candidatus Acidoferrales bacterium]
MGKFLVGLIIGLIAVPLAVYVYFATGMAPVAVTSPPMPFEKKLAHMALHARIDKEAPKTAPIPADEANFTAGVNIYKEHCAVCHGVPGAPQTAISKGEYPKPPKLLEGMGVTDDPPGETYWKVDGGIRMTGMPGFGKSLSTTEMWQVSVLLANADKLPQAVKDILTGQAAAATPATTPETKKK